MSRKILAPSDFATLVGRDETSSKTVLDHFEFPELVYEEITSADTKRIGDDVESVLRDGQLRVSGSNDATVWERGWGEVADSLKGRPITVETLRPQYFRGEPICRLLGKYIRPLAASFEYDAGLALRRLIFDEFLRDAETVVEFGCGTGINLLLLAEQFPRMHLIGCDWATPSRDILAEMARQRRQSIEGHVFNMLTAEGWGGETIDHGTAVLTVHAMEQLGANWKPFIDYVLARKPALVVNIEPILELYDAQSAFDDRARRYHLKRHYLQGYHPFVMELKRAGRAEILASRRVQFGGLYHEAYSILAWSPKP